MKLSKLIKGGRRAARNGVILVVAITLFLVGWWVGLPAKESADHDHGAAESSETWTCSMHPQIRQPNPGLCPICNMDLIPLVDSGQGGLRELSIADEASALLDIRVSPATREPAAAVVRLFGNIAYDERKVTTITSRVSGRLDRLFVDFTGTVVNQGDHLAEIYSPALLVAQRELIESRRGFDAVNASASSAVRETRRRLLEAAREKLRLLQFNEKQISDIEESSTPVDHLTLYAPQAGIVTAKLVNQGQYVETGDPLFKVADLSTVWLQLEAYEQDLQWLRYAQAVEFEIEALAGETFEGRIAFIDPELDPVRRVTTVRVNVENPRLKLKPGMFAKARVISPTSADGRVLDPSLAGKWVSPMHPEIVKDGPGECDICGMDLVPAEELGFIPDAAAAEEPLLIPASAVLRTGNRAVVYVRLTGGEGPNFEGREIVLGPLVGQQYMVEEGLSEGELVVSQGAFKLDSELQIRGKPSMMSPNAGLEERPAHSAPDELAGQWAPMPRMLARLIASPTAEHLVAIKQLVEGIDSSILQPDDLRLWDEFSRRLLNDLAEAERGLAAAPEVTVRGVVRSVEEAGRYLGLPYQPEAAPMADPEVAGDLKAVLAAYFPLAKALADDADSEAKTAASELLEALQASSLEDKAQLAEHAKAIAEAEDLETRRIPFKPLSDQLIALIREQGMDAVGNAYVVHCPMANAGEGADWLAELPEVVNPYYGASMLNCGAVTDTLSVADQAGASTPDSAPEAQEDHSGH